MTQPATTALTMQNLVKLQGTIAPKITPAMLATINASETFKGLMQQAIDQGLKVYIDNVSGNTDTGKYRRADDQFPNGRLTITPDLLDEPARFLGLLAHELLCLTWRSTSLPSVAGRCAIKPRSAG